MLAASLEGLSERKLRTALTAFAVVLGVALLLFGVLGGHSGGAALGPIGGGAALLFLGVALVSSKR